MFDRILIHNKKYSITIYILQVLKINFNFCDEFNAENEVRIRKRLQIWHYAKYLFIYNVIFSYLKKSERHIICSHFGHLHMYFILSLKVIFLDTKDTKK